ncbi:hypothetical protein AQUCO_00201207v1 [Aquilegia coerulea]|uniref:PLATZ transcription factor family protein n=1 Tax=Aquilegia coerulea TaxID=218851 RepID=A0A2G5F712_AQUCA|nr:hypothetical protein AQUCO_00201207v1 [Aquilegia coerulea]
MIRKYVYHDVVRIKDMNFYFNCSKIQTYKNNGSRVVFLNPREVVKPLKSNGDASCVRCERSLSEPHRYCSIACKLAVCTDNRRDESEHLFPVQNQELYSNEDSGSDTKEDDSSESLHEQTEWKEGSPFHRHCLNDSPSFRLKHHYIRRKGFPRRAPFF